MKSRQSKAKEFKPETRKRILRRDGGCIFCNGNKGWRPEMQQYIEEYMGQQYPGWNRDKLVYRKGAWEPFG